MRNVCFLTTNFDLLMYTYNICIMIERIILILHFAYYNLIQSVYYKKKF